MKLFRNKIWNWWDVWMLKWCAFIFGIAAGAYLHEYVLPNIWFILAAAILLAIRPAIVYWKD
jgi:ABC-type phosphate transport system permease subunit